MLIKSENPSTVAPTQEEISSLLNTIFTAESSAASVDASYALTQILLNSVGYRGLHAYGIVAEIKKAASDKKSGLKRESAQNLLGALFERFPTPQDRKSVV